MCVLIKVRYGEVVFVLGYGYMVEEMLGNYGEGIGCFIVWLRYFRVNEV